MNSYSSTPYSHGLPLIGHLLHYQRDRLSLLKKLRDRHGDRFKLKIGPKTLTVLIAPEDVRTIMQTNMKNYVKRTNFDQLFGSGLFTTNGEEWKNQRKLVQPLFGPNYIDSCAKIILDSARDGLEEHVKTDASDIYELYSRATFDVIIKTIIGIDYSDLFEQMNSALTFMSDYLTRSNYLSIDPPLWMSPKKRKFEQCRQLLDDIIYQSIEDQKKRKNRKSFSMISLLLDAQEQEHGVGYDNQRIRDNIITLMFAGFETSALTLSWISAILAQKEELQELLFKEVSDFDLSGPQLKGLSQLPLLDAVVNETLRLYPPGWAWTRVAENDDHLNGHAVKKGDIILISPYLTHRSPLVWERPDDFDHTRFLHRRVSEFAPFSFYPFGAGPRICVGKHFGMVEIKLMLTLVLKSYRFIGSKLPTPRPMATLRSKEGFHVQLVKR